MAYFGKPAPFYRPLGGSFDLKSLAPATDLHPNHVEAITCLANGTLVSSVGSECRLVTHDGWDLPKNTPNTQQQYRENTRYGADASAAAAAAAASAAAAAGRPRAGRRRPQPQPLHSILRPDDCDGVRCLAALAPLQTTPSAYTPWLNSQGLFVAGDMAGRVSLYDAGEDHRVGHVQTLGEHEGQVRLSLTQRAYTMRLCNAHYCTRISGTCFMT